MKNLLSSAAIVFLIATPAVAQQSPYGTNPTPAERAQTEQLNSNADTAAHTPPVAPAAGDADYAAKKADYDRQMRDYQAQRDAYDHDRARYHADRAAYAHHWDVFYGYRGFRDVGRMHRSDLLGLRVSARGGDRIGRVRDVDADGEGRVVRVAVSTGGGSVAWIDADDLRYDPESRVVMTDLTAGDVAALPHNPRF